MGGHDIAESSVTISRNDRSRGTGIPTIGTQPGALDVQLGVAQGDNTTLRAMPANLTRVASRVLGAGHGLGRQDQELFDELA